MGQQSQRHPPPSSTRVYTSANCVSPPPAYRAPESARGTATHKVLTRSTGGIDFAARWRVRETAGSGKKNQTACPGLNTAYLPPVLHSPPGRRQSSAAVASAFRGNKFPEAGFLASPSRPVRVLGSCTKQPACLATDCDDDSRHLCLFNRATPITPHLQHSSKWKTSTSAPSPPRTSASSSTAYAPPPPSHQTPKH